MSIELRETISPATQESKIIYGRGGVTIEAGKSLKIETTPQGEDLFYLEAPAGKKWVVLINIEINETDA